MDVYKAAQILDVETKVLREFDVQDPYNNNTLQGYLCIQSDHRYGSIIIQSVNNLRLNNPQIIYATPKLVYPFYINDKTGERVYKWPKFNRVRVYEKFDGTNILNFSYRDFMGKRFSTFKTRLTPVVRSSEGDSVNFKVLWDEILKVHPKLRAPDVVMGGEYSISYELYGFKNPILVCYNVPLEVSLLFGIRQKDATIEPPEKFSPLPKINLCWGDAGSDKDLIKLYEAMREKCRSIVQILDDGSLYGSEGAVFYVLTEKSWVMYKCKPDQVEKIHWSSNFIDFHAILITAKNALENISADELTVEFVADLLKEEFSNAQIERSGLNIKKAVMVVREHSHFLAYVKNIYLNCPDINKGNNHTLMRYMSQFFNKNQMRLVFSSLKEMGFVTVEEKTNEES